MKKTFAAIGIAALLAVGTLVLAQSQASKPAGDTSLDKIREQNEQILQKQDDILKKLDELSRDMAQIRRRTS